MSTESANPRGWGLAVVAAALGYFVDVYDIWLYAVLRTPSLKALGFTDPDQIKQVGEWLLNWQMAGFIFGAIGFGILSDKKGRLTVLFGSILMYSVANIANGFVQEPNMYAVCRFFAGFGLAGELGAGITLVSELVDKSHRGWATTAIASIGVAGSVAAAKFANMFDWRIGYFIGGGMGLALLLLRFRVFESGMFERVLADNTVRRGDFLGLVKTRDRASRYLALVLSGWPVWFFAGLFMTLSPELQRALNIADPYPASEVVLIGAVGLTLGDVLFGALSQILKSRKKSMLAALALMTAAISGIFFATHDKQTFYWLIFVAGLGAGYWAVFVTTAGEVFGTNLRGTVAITAPSFVRGLVIPLTLVRTVLEPNMGFLPATGLLGVLVLAFALWGVFRLPETYGRDLEFVEITPT